MHIVLAGGSGLIGSALARSLDEDGHRVTRLVRGVPAGPDQVRWRPETGELDPGALAGSDAVVCLSGANVGARRWTAAYKATLRSSRIDTVSTLANALAGLARSGAGDGPRTLLAASAVGYYGDTGDTTVDETAMPGADFLAQLCVAWEAAARPAADAGVRVATVRSGIVLDGDADLVRRLRLVVRLGLGGRLGTGRQFLSWISLRDEVRALRYLLHHEISGPVNLTAPQPVRNAEFVRTMARLLHRPAALAVPGVALRLALGELAEGALTGQRALPAVLQGAGFEFDHPDIDSALRWALGTAG
jgi:uncharacterized protein (TIGR01777 family)